MNNHYPDIGYLSKLAAQAGKITIENFQLGMQREWKSDETPLTASDTAINQLVLDSFRKDFPHIRVVSEEGNYEVEDAEYMAICDPVDGTIPFCHGIPISTFVISILKDRVPFIGLIHDPFNKRLWYATKGEGSWLWGGQPMRVSKQSTVHRSNICMCWWKGTKYNSHRVCEKIMDAGAKWMNACSIAYFGGLIASGEFEASIFPGQKAWETAAMQVIVEEAGGKVTDIYGNPMRYGPDGEIEGHIVSNGLIHDELVRIIAECQK